MNLYPARFNRAYPETAEVPGQAGKWRVQNTPTNCRRLLRVPPPGPAVPTTLPVPADLRSGTTPYPWQERTIRWLLPRQAANLWHVGGAGKSFTALYAALCHGGPIVWVTMGRLKATVRREIMTRTTLRPVLLEGRANNEPLAHARSLVVGWEVLWAWHERLAELLAQGGTLILDEAHICKAWKRKEKGVNPDTGEEVWRDLENISNASATLGRHARVRLALTATPVANTLADLWSPLDVVEPGCWGDNWSFVHRYCDAKKGSYGGLDTTGRSNQPELNARLKELTSIVKKDEIAAVLPPYNEQLIYLSKLDQCRPPAGTADEMKRAAKSGAGAMLEARVFEAAARKRRWIVDFVETRVPMQHKVCIFTARRLDTEDLAAAIRNQMPGLQVWHGHGGHANEDRDLMAEAYMAHPGPCVLVGTGDSFGTGMNLQDTDDAIFAMLPYTWKQLGQWRWRFSRPGQKRPCNALFVIAEGTYDEVIVDILLSKMESVFQTMGDEDSERVVGTLSGDMDDEAIMDALLKKV